jgi:glycosyltransferase involved in cell wall biosynthesis
MRVLHIQKASGISGSERHLLQLLPALAERGIDSRLCLLIDADGERLAAEARGRGIEVEALPAGPDWNVRLVGRLSKRIRAYRPDLVHTHLLHADLFGQLAARVAGVPGVSSVHATAFPYRRQPSRSAARLAGRLARRTIAISHHVARFLVQEELAADRRVTVIHYAVPVGPAGGPDRATVRAEWAMADDKVWVVAASRLVADKGHQTLLEAFARAASVAEELRLLIAGDGPLRAELEWQADALGISDRVWFSGFVDGVDGLLRAADIVAFPTTAAFGEGFGLVNLEAMAAGRPVVASAVDSIPEIVVDGETGILVPPGDPGALAAALVKLAGDRELRARMGERGRHRAASEFRVDLMAERTEAVYREVLAERAGGGRI